MASKTSGTRITATMRRAEAVSLRIKGKTFAEIGGALGVSTPRAYQLVREALVSIAESSTEEALLMRALEAERLDELQLGIWEKATSGDLAAVDRVLKIMERRARLFGLDSPASVATPSEGNSYHSLSVAEIDRRLTAIISRANDREH